jgi:hypothetical protein
MFATVTIAVKFYIIIVIAKVVADRGSLLWRMVCCPPGDPSSRRTSCAATKRLTGPAERRTRWCAAR